MARSNLIFGDTVEEKLLNFREIKDGCWLWTRATSDTGYGSLRLDGTTHNVHKLAYELWVGPVPAELQLDHLCRVRRCFNPAHLEPVTQEENLLRGVAAKVTCKRGHPRTPENLSVRSSGRLRCKLCHCENEVRRKRRKRDEQKTLNPKK